MKLLLSKRKSDRHHHSTVPAHLNHGCQLCSSRGSCQNFFIKQGTWDNACWPTWKGGGGREKGLKSGSSASKLAGQIPHSWKQWALNTPSFPNKGGGEMFPAGDGTGPVLPAPKHKSWSSQYDHFIIFGEKPWYTEKNMHISMQLSLLIYFLVVTPTLQQASDNWTITKVSVFLYILANPHKKVLDNQPKRQVKTPRCLGCINQLAYILNPFPIAAPASYRGGRHEWDKDRTPGNSGLGVPRAAVQPASARGLGGAEGRYL